MRMCPQLYLLIMIVLCIHPATSYATTASPTVMGALGLNTIPSARMEQTGTARFTLSALDPYIHAAASLQLAKPLNVTIRQTAETSGLRHSADRLYPGIDLRLQLWKENAARPAALIGLQSAIGHKRMAGEYFTLSKRHRDFDLTGGMAWGKLGSAAHMENPLSWLHNHFGKRRLPDSEAPNTPDNWFTGPDIGFFGGIEYFSPHIDGLSLKADWGADRYIVENANGYNVPATWGIGLNFRPVPWIDAGAAIIGSEKIMGRINLQTPLQKWIGRKHKKTKQPLLRPYRTGLALPGEIINAAARDEIKLYETHVTDYNVKTKLLLDPNSNTPRQMGRAARHISNHGGELAEKITFTPLSYGIEGPDIAIQRRDLQQAVIRKNGSPQEIWRNTVITPSQKSKPVFRDSFQGFDNHKFHIILDNYLSLSEEDSGLLYRTGFIFKEKRKLSERIWAGGALRINLKDNLNNIRDFRPRAILPVRSNVDLFAARTLSLDQSYLSWMTTPKPDLHVAITGGLLEEMYAGAGGEILYRPFGKTFAIGAEAYQVFKRDPLTDLNLGLNGDRLLTGHAQAWYEFPDSDLTLQARIGRYLAEDVGGTFALEHRFNNGAKMQAFVTATNNADFDIFGHTTHIYSGIKLALPFGHIKHIPEGSEIRITAAPFARDAGQALEKPVDLYEISTPLSYRHITRHWQGITD